jgi:hypothetical protein
MNIGEMNRRIAVLCYEGNEWIEHKIVWGRVEEEQRRCVYSQNGVASLTTWKVTVYRGSGISRKNMLKADGKLLFIAAIAETNNKNHQELSCGVVDVKQFSHELSETGRDELNRPIVTGKTTVMFDGVLTEKYIGTYENAVYSDETQVLILIVPKSMRIKTGTALQSDGRDYVVTLRHETGEYYNEYELTARSDV